MKKAWHRSRPELLLQLRSDTAQFCSTLHVHVENDVVKVRGTYPVLYGSEELDRYSVVIECPDAYPEELPVVKEVGGRIPWIADRHASANGTACVLLPEDRWWSFPPDKPFFDYLSGPLHNYLLGQSIVEAGEPWPFDEHRHGLNGVIDFYKARFITNDDKVVALLLELVASGRFKGHWPCPCQSGKKLRHCHWAGLLDVARRMPPWAARKSLDSIFKEIERTERASASAP